MTSTILKQKGKNKIAGTERRSPLEEALHEDAEHLACNGSEQKNERHVSIAPDILYQKELGHLKIQPDVLAQLRLAAIRPPENQEKLATTKVLLKKRRKANPVGNEPIRTFVVRTRNSSSEIQPSPANQLLQLSSSTEHQRNMWEIASTDLQTVDNLSFQQAPSTSLHSSSKPNHPSVLYHLHDARALERWEQSLADRKMQEDILASKLKVPKEHLLLHKGDSQRFITERRQAIDRALPHVGYGKGYRVGSEFFKQREAIGDELTGLHITLTQTERGCPPITEHIGLSRVVKKELGTLNCPTSSNLPWSKSSYLAYQTDALSVQPPAYPDFSELSVVGKSVAADEESAPVGVEQTFSDGADTSLTFSPFPTDENAKDPLARFPDVKPPILAPSKRLSVQISNTSLGWSSEAVNCSSAKELRFQALCDGNVNELVVSHLPWRNDGSVRVHYHWQMMKLENNLGLVQNPQFYQFHLAKTQGLLRPGQEGVFSVSFHASVAGYFRECWQLITNPMLAGGVPLILELTGISHKPDPLQQPAMEIETKMCQASIATMVKQILDDVESAVRSPPQKRAEKTEEKMWVEFVQQNPEVKKYHFGCIKLLNKLYIDVCTGEREAGEESDHEELEKTKGGGTSGAKGKSKGGKQDKDKGKEKTPVVEAATTDHDQPKPPQQALVDVPPWDLSVATIRKRIWAKADSDLRSHYLERLNGIIEELSFPQPELLGSDPFTVVRPTAELMSTLVNSLVDSVAARAQELRHALDLSPLTAHGSSGAQRDDSAEATVPPASNPSRKVTKRGDSGSRPKKEKSKKDVHSKGKSKSKQESKSAASDAPSETETAASLEASQADPVVQRYYRQLLYAQVRDDVVSMLESLMCTEDAQEFRDHLSPFPPWDEHLALRPFAGNADDDNFVDFMCEINKDAG